MIHDRWTQAGRSSGQAMVVAALALAALLSFTALVLNLGMFVVERRTIQNAVDSAALAGARKLAEEQTSRSFRDTFVNSAVTTLALRNDAEVGTTHTVQAVYLDSSNNPLATVGTASTIPDTAVGVQVTISGPYVTMLSSFAGANSIQIQATARAGLSPLPFAATLANPIPLAAPLAAYQAGSSFDLYDQTVASATYGVSGYQPFLDLASSATTGTGVTLASSFGDTGTNLQFWSDGLHTSGQLGVSATAALASGSYGTNVRAGLLDNVRRQNLVDGNSRSYALLDIPLWNSYQASTSSSVPNTVTIVGFARFKILASDITTTSLPGYFVAYTVSATPTVPTPGPIWGRSRVALTQ